MTQWTVYSREGCTLCEVMLTELAPLLGPAAAEVVVIDIAGNADLESKYGRRIPVLLADGEFVCSYRLDRERLETILQAP
jgi:hypothetical protein